MFGIQTQRAIIIYILLLNLLTDLDALRVFQYYKARKYSSPNQKREVKHIPKDKFNKVPHQEQHTSVPPGITHNPVPMLHPNPFANPIETAPASEEVKTDVQTEGAFCRRSFDGAPGYCILAYQCLHVIRDYRVHGTKIDVCTYRRNVPVICCPLAQKHVEEQRISARKCLEYNDVLKDVPFTAPLQLSGKRCVPSLPMIVGGVTANNGEYPHMAALGWTQTTNEEPIKWGCGGTLISETFVLTAAHCVISGEKPPDVVRLGVSHLNAPISTATRQDIYIEVIILHPKYRSTAYYHDIALLKLSKRAILSAHVRPACLWQLPELKMQTAVAVGWGRTEFRGTKSDVLQKVDLNLIEQPYCKSVYRRERRLPNGIINQQFCAGALEGGKDTCQGDSGGPLHVELPELKCVQFVVGVTSFGKFCGKPKSPGVYTKVYAYLDWIERIAFRE